MVRDTSNQSEYTGNVEIVGITTSANQADVNYRAYYSSILAATFTLHYVVDGYSLLVDVNQRWTIYDTALTRGGI